MKLVSKFLGIIKLIRLFFFFSKKNFDDQQITIKLFSNQLGNDYFNYFRKKFLKTINPLSSDLTMSQFIHNRTMPTSTLVLLL